jgi:hypothetical protein
MLALGEKARTGSREDTLELDSSASLPSYVVFH